MTKASEENKMSGHKWNTNRKKRAKSEIFISKY